MKLKISCVTSLVRFDKTVFPHSPIGSEHKHSLWEVTVKPKKIQELARGAIFVQRRTPQYIQNGVSNVSHLPAVNYRIQG